ncbi:MAG: sigma-70 family RNA polymerase sigma factor [Planctomycetia bacterium]|nr:sigma-70 family RNA polymerase sigma factor [Planctomycetia bacterium]
MIPSAAFDAMPDADLWECVCGGDELAFESAVRRHQSVVAAVAYNACGDLALSEDVAQETFWAAWREKLNLEEPARLKAWLCGIARNLAHHVQQRASRKADAAASLQTVGELSAAAPGPDEAAVSQEEERLVWETLEQIPETYREPLILFYREQQSVTEVARALDLTEEAARQRLSRGRTMLREQVADVVAAALSRSRPTAKFTMAVVAGLGAVSAGAKAAVAGTGALAAGTGASAATGAALKATVAAGAAAGIWGGVLGSLGGFAGGWLGTWLPAQLAPTREERLLLERAGRRILIVSILLSAALAAVMLLKARDFSVLEHLVVMGIWFVAFGTYVTIATIRTVHAASRVRASADPMTDPNDTRLRAAMTATTSRYKGRVFRSRTTLLGRPVLEINVSDPQRPPVTPGQPMHVRQPRVARGWIAIGDDARGIILAIGGRARGFVAFGGRTVGVISVGGLAVGVVAIGGLSLGILSLGGLGLGVYSFGGLAIGWQAAGGGALAWDTAVGGFAAAFRAAMGGAAFANDYAVGGAAFATHANDEAAKAVLENHPLAIGMKWMIANQTWFTVAVVALSILPTLVMLPLMYRREKAV